MCDRVVLERVIEIFVWVNTTILLYLFVPRKKLHEAHISFLIMQVPSWFLGFLVVEYNLVEYPVRFFENASKSSFTFEFYALPAMSVLYTLYFPERKRLARRILYALSFSLVLTMSEVVLEKYTQNINYIHWAWYITWVSLLLVLHLSYLYTKWFMRTVRK
jgi:hypothetical protein